MADEVHQSNDREDRKNAGAHQHVAGLRLGKPEGKTGRNAE